MREFQQELPQLIEQNIANSLEFATAGCAEIAHDKRVVAEVEKVLLQRLGVFVGGGGEVSDAAGATAWPTMASVAASLSAKRGC